MKLAGKVALVTGSSLGIGQAIALRLAADGANVIINYRSHPEDADKTLQEVERIGQESGANGFVFQADIGDISQVNDLVQASIDHFGQLDILVNNAGMERHAPFWEVTEAAYDQVMTVNLKGAFFAAQAAVKHWMATKCSGKIINISSVHEDLPFPNFAPYCLSKGGMKMMARNLAVELGPYGITINNVAPGAIETPINAKLLNDPTKLGALLQNIPLNRLGKSQDVADMVAFLASNEADYITGSTFVVDGGLLWNYHEQ
jgi:glucose 1-dehydrogenase